jgi:hypothetical protein
MPLALCFSYFSDRDLHFQLGPALDRDPPAYASHRVGITMCITMSNLFCWDGGLTNFFPGLALMQSSWSPHLNHLLLWAWITAPGLLKKFFLMVALKFANLPSKNIILLHS